MQYEMNNNLKLGKIKKSHTEKVLSRGNKESFTEEEFK